MASASRPRQQAAVASSKPEKKALIAMFSTPATAGLWQREAMVCGGCALRFTGSNQCYAY
jgi:hypothetical protein